MESKTRDFDHYYNEAQNSLDNKNYKSALLYFNMCRRIPLELIRDEAHQDINVYIDQYLQTLCFVQELTGTVFCKKCVERNLLAYYFNLLSMHREQSFTLSSRLKAGRSLEQVHQKIIKYYEDHHLFDRKAKRIENYKKEYKRLILLNEQ